jgi:hypothetical protein
MLQFKTFLPVLEVEVSKVNQLGHPEADVEISPMFSP